MLHPAMRDAVLARRGQPGQGSLRVVPNLILLSGESTCARLASGSSLDDKRNPVACRLEDRICRARTPIQVVGDSFIHRLVVLTRSALCRLHVHICHAGLRGRPREGSICTLLQGNKGKFGPYYPIGTQPVGLEPH